MRAIVQRVSSAAVAIEGETVAIGRGLLVYLGVGREDTAEDAAYLAEKIAGLRIFEDAAGKMNLDVSAAGGDVLVISAFSLFADARKGRRPSFDPAAPPELAEPLYEAVAAALRERGLTVRTGRFRATMAVRSENAGPVCILLDSRRLF